MSSKNNLDSLVEIINQKECVLISTLQLFNFIILLLSESKANHDITLDYIYIYIPWWRFIYSSSLITHSFPGNGPRSLKFNYTAGRGENKNRESSCHTELRYIVVFFLGWLSERQTLPTVTTIRKNGGRRLKRNRRKKENNYCDDYLINLCRKQYVCDVCSIMARWIFLSMFFIYMSMLEMLYFCRYLFIMQSLWSVLFCFLFFILFFSILFLSTSLLLFFQSEIHSRKF